MTTTIALAGKGGTGKTTIAGLLIRYLKEQRDGILAIDVDHRRFLFTRGERVV